MLERWRHVHNVIVPPAAMTPDEARERFGRGYRLENAYDGDVLVGCSAVRLPQGEEAVATVIARVLPERRGGGIGAALHEKGPAHARGLGAGAVETVVPAADTEGLWFAAAKGFVERERYVPAGERDEWVDLRLVSSPT